MLPGRLVKGLTVSSQLNNPKEPSLTQQKEEDGGGDSTDSESPSEKVAGSSLALQAGVLIAPLLLLKVLMQACGVETLSSSSSFPPASGSEDSTENVRCRLHEGLG